MGEPGPEGKPGMPGFIGGIGNYGEPGHPGEDAGYCRCPARATSKKTTSIELAAHEKKITVLTVRHLENAMKRIVHSGDHPSGEVSEAERKDEEKKAKIEKALEQEKIYFEK
ncbi:hypothetical protein TELCIR_04685 [Teladorsagia circumcincta]|uniref:Collagen triple helix repeat protein n=1 Tax=Teladorsagia circumcincta TaxID=45464 RepID=A0A2G9USY0_TELCI|nr:hypothetical protein TELCIR_04685 [Teladorsagia circumcincta]